MNPEYFNFERAVAASIESAEKSDFYRATIASQETADFECALLRSKEQPCDSLAAAIAEVPPEVPPEESSEGGQCIICFEPGDSFGDSFVPAKGVIPGASNDQVIHLKCKARWEKPPAAAAAAHVVDDIELPDILAQIEAVHGDHVVGAAVDDDDDAFHQAVALSLAEPPRPTADNDAFHRAVALSLAEPPHLPDEELATALTLSMVECGVEVWECWCASAGNCHHVRLDAGQLH